MRKFSLSFLILTTAFMFPAVAQRFHFRPVYNYKEEDLVKQLKTTKTDTGKLNLLFSIAFDNNALVESPSFIDTGYLNQIIDINERAKLFDDKPFHTLLLALRAGAKTNYTAEITLLKTAIDQFDEQNIEIVMLLIEARWIFNVADQQEEKYNFYTTKLSDYLQKGQYRNAASCYHCLAGYYVFKGDVNSSINGYLKAGELFKPFSNLWYMHEFVVIGNRYGEWGNSEKSRFYLQKALKLETDAGITDDKYGIIRTFARLEYDLKHYQASLSYFDQLSVRQTNNNHIDITALKVLNLIGLNKLNEAWSELSKINENSDQSGLARVIQNGNYDIEYAFYKYYLATNDIPTAETHLLSVYRQAKKDAIVQNEVTYLKELTQFYGSQKKPDKAWHYSALYNRLNDSLQSRANLFNVASYENEQKENEQNRKMIVMQQQRAVQEAIIGQRNTIIWISLIGLVAVLGSLIFIYRQLQVNKRNLAHLKTTQTQLIQSEKMASLGELTAGIAHEIQNPLNFVNNFSEVNTELIDELLQEIERGNFADITEIAVDIKGNEQKINQHGKRADSIVKGMLQHSQSGSGSKEPTNINALADECMRLAYHGLRAKDKSFNAELLTHFDEKLPKINVISQDIIRVMLNLFNNAFYAVNQKSKTAGADYKPEVTVSTSTENGQVVIKVKDNGVGIPDAIKEKIMQPFFTTKPTGEGTGLGLSLTYDMVVKGHGGSIQVNSTEGKGSEFIIQLLLT